MEDLRWPVRRPFTPKKSAFLLLSLLLCTHFYVIFTLTSEIFPSHPYSYCEFTDIQLYSDMGHIPFNQTGENLDFTGEMKISSAEGCDSSFCVAKLRRKLLSCRNFPA